MATKKQLNKKINQLELQLHTKKYIHIPMPSWKGFAKFIGFLGLLTLSFFNFMLIKLIWITNNLGYVFESKEELVNYTPKFIDLIILYPIVAQCFLISLTIILFVSLFKELKNYKEEGLISVLIIGLIYGLIIGLLIGLISVLLIGLISGLLIGLTSGLLIGLIKEFN
jgi:hypothetical protein